MVVLGVASVVAVVVAPRGGEEELVRQAATPTITSGPSVLPATSPSPWPSLTPTPLTSGASILCPTPVPPTAYQPIRGTKTKGYTDRAAGYSIAYPSDWTICQALHHSTARDFFSALELFDADAVLHASILVFRNPANMTVEEWIRDHNALFFQENEQITTRMIGGVSGVYAVVVRGQHAPQAYLEHRGRVISISGVTAEDFEAIVGRITLYVQAPGELPICPPMPATSWVWTHPSPSTQHYANEELGFSLLYPSDWILCEVGDPPQYNNPRLALQFNDRAGLGHASLWVYQPASTNLDESFNYYQGPIEREETTIGGERAFFFTKGAEGSVAAATFARHGLVFELGTGAQADYDAVVAQFQFLK